VPPPAPPPGHLTLTGLVPRYALYAGLGWLAGGSAGGWWGAALVTALYGRQIWHAASRRHH
jgi:hypothetical protein